VSAGRYQLPSTRAASAVITKDNPRKSMLIPTRSPIAQAAELGHPCQIRNASSKSMMPLNTTQPQLRR
jgi:hypothetical protein